MFEEPEGEQEPLFEHVGRLGSPGTQHLEIEAAREDPVRPVSMTTASSAAAWSRAPLTPDNIW